MIGNSFNDIHFGSRFNKPQFYIIIIYFPSRLSIPLCKVFKSSRIGVNKFLVLVHLDSHLLPDYTLKIAFGAQSYFYTFKLEKTPLKFKNFSFLFYCIYLFFIFIYLFIFESFFEAAITMVSTFVKLL